MTVKQADPAPLGKVPRQQIGSASSSGRIATEVRSGVAWSGVALLAESGLRFLVKLILARLLVPEHFGLIGMAVVFTGLVQAASDLGLSAALVQRKAQDLRAADLHTVFWAGCAAGGIGYLLLALIIGPFAAYFYGEAMVWPIIAVVGLSLLIRPLGLVHRALLTRDLHFRRLAYVSVVSVGIASGLAIGLAAFGAGVWSIAWQGVAAAAVAVPLLWKGSDWRPELSFSWSSLQQVLGFGGYVTGNDLAVYLTKNLDYLLIGKFVGAGALGAYTLAFLLTDTFRSSLMSVLNRVMFPVYGKLQDDATAIRSYYLRVVRYNMLPLVPLMVLFAALAKPIVTLGFGDVWHEAIFPLQVLSVAVIVHAFGGTAASVMRGLGRADLEFKQYLWRAVLFNLPVLGAGIYLAGIDGAAVAVLMIKVVGRMVQQYFLRSLIAVRERDLLRAAGPALVGGAGMWLLLTLLTGYNPPDNPVDLFVAASVGLAAYVLIVLPLVHRELTGLRHRTFRA